MKKEKISLSISFESLITAIQSLNLDQLLKAREYIGALIEQTQDEAGEDKLTSESEIDYSYLQELLARGVWEEADEEQRPREHPAGSLHRRSEDGRELTRAVVYYPAVSSPGRNLDMELLRDGL